MTYTRTWTTTAPADTSAANQLGLDIRQLRQDIQDRMNSIVVDWTADPVVPQAILGGGANNKVIYMGSQAFNYNSPLNSDQSVTYGNGVTGLTSTATGSSAPPTLFCSFPLPQGITINQVFINVTPNSTASVQATFVYVNNGPSNFLIPIPTPSLNQTITVVPGLVPGVPLLGITGALNFSGSTGGYLTVQVSSSSTTSSFTLFSAGVIYNCPTAVNTL